MESSERLTVERFTTAGLPRQDRHEAWVSRDWPSLAPAYLTVPVGPFDVTSDRLRLDELLVHYVTISGQHWIRDVERKRSFDPDLLSIAITIDGNAHGLFGDRAMRTGAGDLQLADFARTSRHVSSASQTILLAVPRALATRRGIDVGGMHGVVLRSGSAALLAEHLMSIRRMATTLPADSGRMLAVGVLDLLDLAILGSGRPAPAETIGRAGLEIAARAAIEREVGTASFSVARLSHSLGISRSTLHRMFEADGGVQAYVRQRRLEAVRRALEAPDNREPIQQLAERLGFSDPAHLSRSFRAAFGLTPSDCRAQARAAAQENGVRLPRG